MKDEECYTIVNKAMLKQNDASNTICVLKLHFKLNNHLQPYLVNCVEQKLYLFDHTYCHKCVVYVTLAVDMLFNKLCFYQINTCHVCQQNKKHLWHMILSFLYLCRLILK